MSPKLRIACIALASAIVLYVLFGFFLAPRLVRSNLLTSLRENVTAEPSLERVRVNPLKLTLTLSGFALREDTGKSIVAFDRLFIGLDPLSPFRRAVSLRELTIEKPSIAFVLLEDRSLRIMKLLKPRPAAATPPDSTQKKPFPFHARLLRVIDGTLSFEDRSRDPHYEKALIPMQIELTDFTTHRDEANAYSFEASTDTGERISWRGGFHTRPFSSEGEFRFDAVKSATIEEFLEDTMPFVLSRGMFGLGAKYRIDARTTPAEVEVTSIAVDAADVAMVDRASGEEVIAAQTLATEGGTIRPLQRHADLGTVTLTAPHVLVWMDSTGVISFQKWATASPDSGAPWITEIQQVGMTGAVVEFQDRRLEPPAIVRATNGTLELGSFSTAKGDTAQIKMSCALGGGEPPRGGAGSLAGEGKLVATAAALVAEVDLADFDVQAIEPYVRVFSKIDITGGTASGKGTFAFNAFGPPGPMLRFTGDAASANLKVIDEVKKNDLLSWKKLEIKKLEYDMSPNRTQIGEIVARGAFMRVVIAEDRTSNLQAIAVPEEEKPPAFRTARADTAPIDSATADSAPASSPPPAEPPLTTIDLVRIEDGTLDFSDLSLRPNFRTGIYDVNGTIRELSSEQAAHAAIELAGNAGPHAPATISGTINPLNARGTTDVAMRFENIELTTFTPYSGKFMGYPIERGKLDLDLHYVIENRQLLGENDIVMRQLTLGDKVDSPDATSLPVKFAIALLKDRNGDIQLDIPVKGDLDDPKFSVFPIVLKLLVGLVTKAAMSPFKLFGAIFGGDDEGSEPAIHFAHGSAEIDSTEVPKLDAIAKGLADRPAINLEIEAVGDAERDSAAAFRREMDAMLRGAPPKKKEKNPDPATVAAATKLAPPGWDPGDYARSLARAYANGFKKAPPIEAARKTEGAVPDSAAVAIEELRLRSMAESLATRVPPVSELVSALPMERAQRVQGYLLQRDSTVTATRIFLIADKGTFTPDSTGVRMGLTLRD